MNTSYTIAVPRMRRRGVRIPKPVLGLAGEYAVASEICRRGYHAQITFGRWKNTDILAVNLTSGRTVLVEVKSKQGKVWPSVKGIKGYNRVQVLVDYRGKEFLERPDFYVLDERFWRSYIEEVRGRLKEVREDETRIIHVWPDGYEGVALKPEEIEEYRERWGILEEKLS